MKKLINILAILILSITFAYAQEEDTIQNNYHNSGFYIGIGANSWSGTPDIPLYTTSVENLDGISPEFFLGYSFTDNISLELNYNVGTSVSQNNGTLNIDYNLSLISFDLLYSIPLKNPQIKPFILAGLGSLMYKSSYKWSDGDFSEGINSTNLFKIGGGVDYFFNKNFGIIAKATYNMALDNSQVYYFQWLEQEDKINTFSIGLGLKVRL